VAVILAVLSGVSLDGFFAGFELGLFGFATVFVAGIPISMLKKLLSAAGF
jgi:hypothetical protein